MRPGDGATITVHTWRESADQFEQVKVDKRRYRATLNGVVIEDELHTMILRWYFKHEMTMMLEHAGFQDIFIHGDYTDDAATSLSSETVYRAMKS